MDTMKKKCAIYVGTFFGTTFLLWMFLVVAAMIPNSLIQENMKESALAYARTDAFVYSEKQNETVDNYADAIWLNIAWYMGEGNPFVSTLDTCYYDG